MILKPFLSVICAFILLFKIGKMAEYARSVDTLCVNNVIQSILINRGYARRSVVVKRRK